MGHTYVLLEVKEKPTKEIVSQSELGGKLYFRGKIFQKVVNSYIKFIRKIGEDRIQEKRCHLAIRVSISEFTYVLWKGL